MTKFSSFPPLLLHLPWILFFSTRAPSLAYEGSNAVSSDLSSPSGEPPSPSFSVSWADNRSAFQAGEIATIIINETELTNSSSDPANFSLSVGGIKGNSSYISSVISSTAGDLSLWSITFVPIWAGEFTAIVAEEHSGAADSSLTYSVTPGALYQPASIASWMNLKDEIIAGEKAKILVLLKDAFGNHISSINEVGGASTFTLSSSTEDGSLVESLNFTYQDWDDLGRVEIEFFPTIAGSLRLHVDSGNQSLAGSPLPFRVKPGDVDIRMCEGKWRNEINAIKIFSRLEFLVHQRDRFGNPVTGFYPFDAGVVKKETNLSIPLTDLALEEAEGGVQLLSFFVAEPGTFMLRVFDAETKLSISNTSYEYSVFVGYCDGGNSVINGSGLFSSVAGRMSYFSIYLEDDFRNTSPVEARILAVHILRNNDTLRIKPAIVPQRDIQGADQGSTVQSSAFSVIYVPERSGNYDIRIFCGNIPLNRGQPFAMKASPGAVDSSKSSVVEFDARVKKLKRNKVKVQLLDSLNNPGVSQEGTLGFNLVNGSGFLRWPFADYGEGIYAGYYVARELGAYNICVSYEKSPLSPCPFEVNVYNDDYFPDAKNDSLSVWEDESLVFDVTVNDYFSGIPIRLSHSSMPAHGSLIQEELLFRYTPFKGFFGIDVFSYTLTDANDNVATASVSISVLCKPPQFISLPSQLQVNEDLIGPQFGGFRGFAMKYSDKIENISLTIGAKFGSLFLSPMPYWPTLQGEIRVLEGGQTGRNLTLTGTVKALNSALESIQYLGDENFYGDDVISLSAMNKNGIREARVAVKVNPVNDPPFIRVPKFVVLEREPIEGVPIFGEKFEFFVGDPDLPNFPENESSFLVTLSLELSDGLMIASLPSHLIGTVELKIKNSHQWHHLQAFVTISNHFLIKGKGFRFRATIADCNNAIKKLLYLGSGPGSLLTINVNDMGNYGQCAECETGKSTPLQAEATVNLIRRKRVNSISTHLLGIAVVVEFIVLSLLGGALLFYIIKCTSLLYRHKSPPPATEVNPNSRGGEQIAESNLRRRYRGER